MHRRQVSLTTATSPAISSTATSPRFPFGSGIFTANSNSPSSSPGTSRARSYRSSSFFRRSCTRILIFGSLAALVVYLFVSHGDSVGDPRAAVQRVAQAANEGARAFRLHLENSGKSQAKVDGPGYSDGSDDYGTGWSDGAKGGAGSGSGRGQGSAKAVPKTSANGISSSHSGGGGGGGGPVGLSYRRKLELTTSPKSYIHSPTMTFSSIYVLSLPTRQDRRAKMTKIADALGVKIEFVDALDKSLPIIQWIGEQLAVAREKKRSYLANWMGVEPDKVGGLSAGSVWLARHGDVWKGDTSFPSTRLTQLQNPDPDSPAEQALGNILYLPEAEKREEWGGMTWTDYLEKHADEPSASNPLRPSDPEFNITEALWDHMEYQPKRQLNEAVISTWFSHSRVIRRMREKGDESALVLEDDVDIEWDLERIWAGMERRLTGGKGDGFGEGENRVGGKGKDMDWEMVFLGHCWGAEVMNPAYLHPLLREATAPRCLHGYALSKRGYNRLHNLLQDPWSAYQVPIDVFVPSLTVRTPPPKTAPHPIPPKEIRDNPRLSIVDWPFRAYSAFPPLIIQSKSGRSDIQSGIGSPWRGVLMDSILERIALDEYLSGESSVLPSAHKNDRVDETSELDATPRVDEEPSLSSYWPSWEEARLDPGVYRIQWDCSGQVRTGVAKYQRAVAKAEREAEAALQATVKQRKGTGKRAKGQRLVKMQRQFEVTDGLRGERIEQVGTRIKEGEEVAEQRLVDKAEDSADDLRRAPRTTQDGDDFIPVRTERAGSPENQRSKGIRKGGTFGKRAVKRGMR